MTGPWRCLMISCGDSPNSAAARRQRVVAHPWRHVDVRLQRLVPRALPHRGQAQRHLCPRRPPRLAPELHPLRRQRRPHVRRRLRPRALLSKSVSRPICTLWANPQTDNKTPQPQAPAPSARRATTANPASTPRRAVGIRRPTPSACRVPTYRALVSSCRTRPSPRTSATA